jgi:hypothetical protein
VAFQGFSVLTAHAFVAGTFWDQRISAKDLKKLPDGPDTLGNMWPGEGQPHIQAPTKLKTSHGRDTAGALIGLREAGDKFNCPRYQEAPLWKSGRGPLSGEKVRAQTRIVAEDMTLRW